MGTVTNSVPTFNGTSQFAGDLQTVIDNAVKFASAPITAMQTQQTIVNNQSQAVSALDADFTSLQTALQTIQTDASGPSLTAKVSNTDVISASVGSGAATGNYTILVSQQGAYSTTLSNPWTGTSKGTPDTYALSIGQQTYNLTTTDNSATSVASAINSQYGTLVQATVVNVGSNSSPSYRISLQSVGMIADKLDLTDNGTSTAAVQTAGEPVQYEINNSGNVISSDSRSVNIAAGVTLNILGQSDTAVNIDVTQDASTLSNDIGAFVTAYNTAQTDLSKQRGQYGGPLQGTELINQLQQVLNNLVTYSPKGNSAVNGWMDLGVAFPLNGDDSVNTLTFDPSKLEVAQAISPSAVAAFLGSAPGSSFTTGDASDPGSGFLLAATNALTSLEDPINGLLKTTESDYQSQLNQLSTRMSNKQAQVDLLKDTLTKQMNTADAMINSLQQKYTNLTGLLQAEQIAAQQYKG